MSQNTLFMVIILSKSIGLLVKIECGKGKYHKKRCGSFLENGWKRLYGLFYSCVYRLNVNEIRFLKDKMKENLEITAKFEICFSYKLKFEYQFKVLCCD